MDDRKIIKDIINGDKEKYRELVEKHQQRLVNFIFAQVYDYDLANDIAQLSFIKAYNSLRNYNPKYEFSTWLYTIAINLTKSEMKKRKNISLEEAKIQLRSKQNISDDVIKEQQAQTIRSAVTRLSKRYQMVINLYYWQELSYKEISDIMKVNINTIRTWISRAKKELKQQLNGQI